MANWRLAGLRPVAVMAGLLLGLLVAPVSARAPELAMLDRLTPGKWDLQIRGEAGRNSICLRTGLELIQIRHRRSGCSRAVVEDTPSRVTVEYSCPGSGYGRTTIRRENAGLVQINSQGIQAGRPFNFNAEGRRVGGC